MFASILLVLIAASPGAEADGQSASVGLIGRLSSEWFDERVAASKELERLGSAALPALRAAASSSDPQIRARSIALIESISRQADADRLSIPTRIAVDFHNRALGEVVDLLNERHNRRLSLRHDALRGSTMTAIVDLEGYKRSEREFRERLISLESSQPLAFSEVIDRLCRAGGLRYQVTASQLGGSGPVATAKASAPLVIPLIGKEAVGRQVASRYMAFVIDGNTVEPGNRFSVSVTVRANRENLVPHQPVDRSGRIGASVNLHDLFDHFELHDTTGQRIKFVWRQQPDAADSQGFYVRYKLIPPPAADDNLGNGKLVAVSAVPAELRYYEFVRKPIEVSFDFHDIPMP